ncbi:putative bifunctional diguanylate cyclase/phosphodiesterase [Marinilactibacillus kalidii]|uniref:putative bifunctional diguanylate cyclase/phosphodiesterase n=1 Tax=Marinilactibacillus kalidii TaxID=2820274 RepID=UPI001ABDFB27|nr:EAL domain-containing protein [Marinilactibacillus kalidii]
MLKKKRSLIIIILINLLVLFGWDIIFQDNAWLKSLNLPIIHTMGILFSIIEFYKAYRRKDSHHIGFWLLLTIGTTVYFLGNLSWIFVQILNGNTTFTGVEYFLWMIARIIYLVALFYCIREINKTRFNKIYFFNFLIFMITTASVTLYYLIEPTLDYAEQSLTTIIIILMYPTINLSILLMISILTYLVHKRIEHKTMLFLVVGFLATFIGDTYYTYLEPRDRYQPDGLVNYLWIIGIWSIGLAGYLIKKQTKSKNFAIEHISLPKVVIPPYVSTIILIFLVIHSYGWAVNSLSFGLLIVIGMIIFRQLLMIKENNKLIDEFSYLAYHDPLTNLSNRTKFKDTLEIEMENAQDEKIALLLIDLDRFKVTNDTLGHQVGDELLVQSARRIEEVLAPNMQLFRLGGDEFAVIIVGAYDSICKQTADKILQNIEKTFKLNEYEISLTSSIGISVYPDNGSSYEELFKFADTAMYLAKDSGKNRFQYYDGDLSEIMNRRLRIESDLRKGLDSHQFELYYQPKVELFSKEMMGMEALLRWHHPDLGPISPGEFIPIAEETGQIVAIGEWVLRNACIQTKKWQDMGLPAIRVSVNVSVKQFQHGGLVAIVKRALEESGLEPRYLEIEVTESIMQNTTESSEVLHQFREMGIEISIDDFGTGYSSLNVIQQLPINTIKLDRSFITNIEDESQLSMVKTIINLGENLNLDVVAEGIETEYQLSKLIESRCKIGQGYLFSRPIKADQFELLLRNGYTVAEEQ